MIHASWHTHGEKGNLHMPGAPSLRHAAVLPRMPSAVLVSGLHASYRLLGTRNQFHRVATLHPFPMLPPPTYTANETAHCRNCNFCSHHPSHLVCWSNRSSSTRRGTSGWDRSMGLSSLQPGGPPPPYFSSQAQHAATPLSAAAGRYTLPPLALQHGSSRSCGPETVCSAGIPRPYRCGLCGGHALLRGIVRHFTQVVLVGTTLAIKKTARPTVALVLQLGSRAAAA